jgi:hypothetical protein
VPFTHAFLRTLTKGMSDTDGRDLRQHLEAALVPMIRCALRSGLGQPELVRWVQRHRPANELGRLDREARCMARMLSGSLLEQLEQPQPTSRWAAETVAGL